MVAMTMAKRDEKRQRVKAGKTYPSQVNAFSWIDGDVIRKFDELAEDQHRSRSAQIAWLVEQYVDLEHPKLLAKRQQAAGGD